VSLFIQINSVAVLSVTTTSGLLEVHKHKAIGAFNRGLPESPSIRCGTAMTNEFLYLLLCSVFPRGHSTTGRSARDWKSWCMFGFLSRRASIGGAQEVPVEDGMITGNRRVPESTIQGWISIRTGDTFDAAKLDRDIRVLYAQGHFADVKAYTEDGPKGGKVVTIEVKEWPLILEIRYEGLKSVDPSNLRKEYRRREIGLPAGSEYGPVSAKRAGSVIKDMLADAGHPDATVQFEAEDISRTAISLTFIVDEDPLVK
jgi:outer membrane protein assembly factor BamA